MAPLLIQPILFEPGFIKRQAGILKLEKGLGTTATPSYKEVEPMVKDSISGSVALRGTVADDSDFSALSIGFVSILPMNLQLTNDNEKRTLAKVLGMPDFGDQPR